MQLQFCNLNFAIVALIFHFVLFFPAEGQRVVFDLVDDGSIDAEFKLPKVVVYLLICICGLFGNLIAIIIILTLKEYQNSVTHWYILQLAIADSLFLLTLPFNVSEKLNQGFIYPEWMCKAKESILQFNYYASIIFLMIMSIDRYIAICHTFSDRLQKLRKKLTSRMITTTTWFISFLLCLPVMIYSFKVGIAPHCTCGLEFPGTINQTAYCIEEGFSSEQLLEKCLSLQDNMDLVGTGEIHCRPASYGPPDGGAIVFPSVMPSGGFELVDNNGSLFSGELFSGSDYITDSFDFNDFNRMNDFSGYSGSGAYEYISASTQHIACYYWDAPSGWKAMIIFNFVAMFLVPVIVTMICYGLIIRRLSMTRSKRSLDTPTTPTSIFNHSNTTVGKMRMRMKTSRQLSRNRKLVTMMCAAFVITFFICWGPFHIYHLAKIVGIKATERFCEALAFVGTSLAYLNSALNPYLYSCVRVNFTGKWKLLKRSLRIQRPLPMKSWKSKDTSSSSRPSRN